MKGRLALVAGLAAGYVLGTRAGREQYERISAEARRLWEKPEVQDQVTKVSDTVKEQAPVVQAKVAEAASTAAHAVNDTVADLREDDDQKAQKQAGAGI